MDGSRDRDKLLGSAVCLRHATGLWSMDTYDASRNIPQEYGRRQSHDISHTSSEVEKQKEVAHEAAGKGGAIQGNAPDPYMSHERLNHNDDNSNPHQRGSGKPRASSSLPAPLSSRFCLQGVTQAAIESRFAKGPVVAAINGIAVEANHQSLLVSSVGSASVSLIHHQCIPRRGLTGSHHRHRDGA